MSLVFTNGCFDILHRGHLRLFEYCRSLGKEVHVGIDSDKRIKLFKGQSRPVNCEEDRKFMLESIKFIDKVYIFDTEKELCNLVNTLSPDIMIVGSDYKNQNVIGSEYSKKLMFYDKIYGYSTSKIIRNISGW